MYHTFKEDGTIVVYLHTHKLDIKQVLFQELPVAFGKYSNRTCTLMTLFVPEHIRLQGIGSNLIFEIAKECHLIGCRRIDVDDMSDRCFQPHNIYIKHGFRYLKSWGSGLFNGTKMIKIR